MQRLRVAVEYVLRELHPLSVDPHAEQVADGIERILEILKERTPNTKILLLGVFESRNIWTVVFAICIAGWVKYARTIRGSVLEVKENAYVTAAKASGARDFRILFRHILPNVLPPIFVLMAVDLAVVIMLESTLSFLGVGVPITEPSLGMMISIGKNYVYAGMWWMVVFPGFALLLSTLAFNILGDGLRDALDPQMKGRT